MEADKHSYYHVTVFRRNLHLKLKSNHNFMARDLSVETYHGDGSVTSELLRRTENHYLGRVNDDAASMVAVTKENEGLVRARLPCNVGRKPQFINLFHN